jgi:hypothetical protein
MRTELDLDTVGTAPRPNTEPRVSHELAKALLETASEILGGPLIGVEQAKVLAIVNFLYCCLEDTSHARWPYARRSCSRRTLIAG